MSCYTEILEDIENSKEAITTLIDNVDGIEMACNGQVIMVDPIQDQVLYEKIKSTKWRALRTNYRLSKTELERVYTEIDDIRPNNNLVKVRTTMEGLQNKQVVIEADSDKYHIQACHLKKYAIALNHKMEIMIHINGANGRYAQFFVNKSLEEALTKKGMFCNINAYVKVVFFPGL